MLDEDADLREYVAALGPGALADFRRVLEGQQTCGDALLREFIARPQLADLATLIAMADTGDIVGLRSRDPSRGRHLTLSHLPPIRIMRSASST